MPHRFLILQVGAVAIAAAVAAGPHLVAQTSSSGDGRSPSPTVASLHVQGNVWMIAGPAGNVAVQIGRDGVLVVDTMTADLADDLLGEIRRLAGDRPIRYIVNTHAHADHTGGNEKVAAAGRSIVSGNVVGDIGPGAANFSAIVAHEHVLRRFSNPSPGAVPVPARAWPTTTFFTEEKDLYFNGEGIQLIHVPSAHTDGDVLVYFRGSDVVVAGDLFVTTTFPLVDVAAGGNLKGVIAGLNRIIDIAIPRDKQEGGTYVVPGHGRLTDEADVVDYRDMVTIVRDRVADAIDKGMTAERVRAARLTRDYDSRYGGQAGSAADQFVAAADTSVRPAVAPPATPVAGSTGRGRK